MAKNYIDEEIMRNKKSADLYSRMIRKAFGGDTDVMVGHHFAFQDPATGMVSENEIPSADTLLFDHEIMSACFGEDAVRIMQMLASVPVEDRDAILREAIEQRDI